MSTLLVIIVIAHFGDIIMSIETRPTVGIIRWDAFNQIDGHYDDVSKYVQNDMSPQQFHYRLPFFASITPNVSFNNDQQDIIDREILYAHNAGIDYFAFDTYCKYGPNCETNSPYCQQYANQTQCCDYCPQNPSYALDRYFESKHKNLINFTLILLGTIPCDPQFTDYYVSLMSDISYQTVTINNIVRPLVYLFMWGPPAAQFCGGWDKSKQAFDNIRNAAIKSGLNNPYFVYMFYDIQVEIAYNFSSLLGFDAISLYAMACDENNGYCSANGTVYSSLATQNRNWWENAYSNRTNNKYNVSHMVPYIMTGWDPRPRWTNPPPWADQGPYHYLQPTEMELRSIINDAINFTCTYPEFAEAQTVIMYAWNECTENGACIIPTLGNGTYYVDAMAKVLPQSC